MTSSCLCKSLEGAGFPFQVKAIEETTLDNIGGAQLLPEMFWEAKNANRSGSPFLTASPSSDTQFASAV